MAGGKRALLAEDLFRLTMIGDVAVSPDGTTICFVQTRMDRESNSYLSDLWMVPSGGMAGEATRFTHGPNTVAQPRWSANGRWLAFLADREPKGRKQLWIIPTSGAGGEARQLTKGETAVSDFAWSPDGTKFAFVRSEKFAEGNEGSAVLEVGEGRVADDVVTLKRIRHKGDGAGFTNARRSHLWVVDLEGNETRLTEGDHNNSAPTWSPDCTSVAFVSQRGDDERDFTDSNDLWVVAAEGGAARRLPTPPGPVDAPAWSPDGTLIAYVGGDRPNAAGANDNLWVIPAEGEGEPRNLTATLDLSMNSGVSGDAYAGLSGSRPVWAPDSSAIFVIAATRGDTPLWRVPVAGGEATKVVDRPGQVQAFAFCAAGTTLALNLSDHLSNGDVYSAGAGDVAGTLRQLTEANGALFAEVELSRPEGFEYGGADGWPIHAWLMPPIGVKEGEKYPLALEIHGGPHAAYGDNFMFEFQLLAAQGIGVVFTNPRGSTSYGERFTMASNDDWGGNDYRDVMLGVDAALARAPWADGARLGVLGGSYGGYLTNWIVTQTNRFKAAVTMRSICNMTSKWGTSDIGFIGNDLQWGGAPWRNVQFYAERSPLTHVEKVVTPLLIIHSERDLRCPIEQGEQFFSALKYLRRTVEFVRFPDEGHELSRSGQPIHRLENQRRIVGWFKKYL
ncbi:MAG: S9 family peptidase [Thermomicrobiales bacterium]